MHPSVISIFVLTSNLSKYHLSLTIYQFVISPSVICLVSMSLVSVSLSLRPPLSVISVSVICLVSIPLVSPLSLSVHHLYYLSSPHPSCLVSMSLVSVSPVSLCPSILSVISPPIINLVSMSLVSVSPLCLLCVHHLYYLSSPHPSSV